MQCVPKGYYQVDSGASSCLFCSPGMYQDAAGRMNCSNCSVGFAQDQ